MCIISPLLYAGQPVGGKKEELVARASAALGMEEPPATDPKPSAKKKRAAAEGATAEGGAGAGAADTGAFFFGNHLITCLINRDKPFTDCDLMKKESIVYLPSE